VQLTPAARRIQRAFRAFRAQFPGGRLRSASSSASVHFQEAPEFRSALAAGFCEALRRAAMIDPAVRAPVLGEARRQDFKDEARRRGLVRAVVDADDEIAFSGAAEAVLWAKDGFAMAVRKMGDEDTVHLLMDMARWEVDYVVVKFQLDEAPRIMASVFGRPIREVLRTAVQRRSLTPKRGHEMVRHVVPIDERMLAEAGNELRVVGAPGDRFRLKPDMRRFLHHALGGFQHYKWQLNPRRRRRVAGRRLQRWILHVFHGQPIGNAYRILRTMAAWAPKMDPARNWEALFARPLVVMDGKRYERRLSYAMHHLARRLLREVGKLPRGSYANMPASAGRKLLSYVTTTARDPASASASSGKRSSSRSGSGSGSGSSSSSSVITPEYAEERSTAVAGYLVDADHAGFFHARAVRRTNGRVDVELTVFDPHAANTFAPSVFDTLGAQLKFAMTRYQLDVRTKVRPAQVPEELALQYAWEGSCGPSSVALLMSMMRLMRGQTRGARLLAQAMERMSLGSADRESREAARAFQETVFRQVSEEEVVASVQLLHSAVV
jgi:hypothetical protein